MFIIEAVFNEYLCRSVKYASVSVPSQPHKRIPIIVYECVNRIKNFGIFFILIALGLDKLGLFRVSGAERRVSQLESIFDKGPDYGLGWYRDFIHFIVLWNLTLFLMSPMSLKDTLDLCLYPY